MSICFSLSACPPVLVCSSIHTVCLSVCPCIRDLYVRLCTSACLSVRLSVRLCYHYMSLYVPLMSRSYNQTSCLSVYTSAYIRLCFSIRLCIRLFDCL